MSIFTHIKENNLIDLIKLVNHGTNINEKNDDGYTALVYASCHGYFEIVKYLVQHNAEINEKTILRNTALIMASSNGHFKIVKYLVQHNAEINHTNYHYRCTAIICASRYGHFAIVKYLMKYNCLINIKSSYNYTALTWAYFNKHFEIVKFFKSVTLKRIKFI